MEITFVEYTQQEQQERSDEMQSSTGNKPTEVQLYQALQNSTESLFPDLEVKRIARAKGTQTLIFIMAPVSTKVI